MTRRIVGTLMALVLFIVAQWSLFVCVDNAYHAQGLYDRRLLIALGMLMASACCFVGAGLFLGWGWRRRSFMR